MNSASRKGDPGGLTITLHYQLVHDCLVGHLSRTSPFQGGAVRRPVCMGGWWPRGATTHPSCIEARSARKALATGKTSDPLGDGGTRRPVGQVLSSRTRTSQDKANEQHDYHNKHYCADTDVHGFLLPLQAIGRLPTATRRWRVLTVSMHCEASALSGAVQQMDRDVPQPHALDSAPCPAVTLLQPSCDLVSPCAVWAHTQHLSIDRNNLF